MARKEKSTLKILDHLRKNADVGMQKEEEELEFEDEEEDEEAVALTKPKPPKKVFP